MNLFLSLFDFIRALRPNYQVVWFVLYNNDKLFEGVPIEAEMTAKAHERPSDAKRAAKKNTFFVADAIVTVVGKFSSNIQHFVEITEQ